MNSFIEETSITSNMFAEEKDVFCHDKIKNIFVMNNHRLAFFCWQKFFSKNNKKITLVHIDYHPDASFVDEKEIEGGKTNYDDIKTNPDLAYITNKYLDCANFIDTFALKNNHNVKIISIVHEYEIGSGFDKYKETFETETFSNRNEKEFFKYLEKENIDILDIDLDYFLDVNQARNVFTPWSKERIDNFFLNLFNAIKYPKIVTIVTSPNYMGTTNISETSMLPKRASFIYGIVEKNLHKYFSKGSYKLTQACAHGFGWGKHAYLYL